MTEKDLDIAIEKCERIMEFDTRTLKNPESENGYIFEKVYDLLQFLRELQFSTNAISVVRCKDCKHRPTGTNRDDLEFPDDKCPCKCEDYWYSWKPSDDWFCKNGEQKDGDGDDRT